MRPIRLRMARPMPRSTRIFVRFFTALLLMLLLCCWPAAAQLVGDQGPPPATRVDSSNPQIPTPVRAGKKRLAKDFTIKGDSQWTDTNIEVQAGERVLITAPGKLRYLDAKEENGTEGVARGFKDLLRILPFNGAGRGAVIGRIGDADIAETFLIGAQREVPAPVAGRLAVGLNQAKTDSADGSYSVHIEVYAPEAKTAGTPRVVAQQVKSLPGIDNTLFAQIPRRIGDKDGNPGDMVNFLILGSESGMQRVFTTAGWVKVDSHLKDTVLPGLFGRLSKRAHFTKPISQLYS